MLARLNVLLLMMASSNIVEMLRLAFNDRFIRNREMFIYFKSNENSLLSMKIRN